MVDWLKGKRNILKPAAPFAAVQVCDATGAK